MKTLQDRLGLIALLCAGGLVPSGPAMAQEPPTQYCYQWGAQSGCLPTLEAAEAALRAVAPPTYRPTLRGMPPTPTGRIDAARGLEEWQKDYIVLYRDPERVYSPGYWNGWSGAEANRCESAGNPHFPQLCKREIDSVNALYEYQKQITPQCNFGPVQSVHEYASLFAQISQYPRRSRYGLVSYHDKNKVPTEQRKWVYSVMCPGWSAALFREINMTKSMSFDCPDRFMAVEGYWSSVYAFPGENVTLVSRPRCMPADNDRGRIYYYQQGTDSCPAGDNPAPCHPATGDKSRNEADFEFAGEPFTRYYHSLRHTAMVPAFAPGWTHSYSDRVIHRGQTSMSVIRENGVIEYFLPTGNSSWKSSRDSRKRLLQLPEGGYALHEESGLSLYFNAAGRLIRRERNVLGLDTVTLAYDGERLATATDQAGRMLRFNYVDGQLQGITLPGGREVLFTFDEVGNFAAVQYPDGKTKQYHYGEDGLASASNIHALTGITDETGTRFASFGYDASGKVILSARHDGATLVEKTTVSYADPDHPIAVLPSGETVRYDLVRQGPYRRITGVSGSFGGMRSIYNGSSGQLSETWALSGSVARFEYAEDYVSTYYQAYGTNEQRKFVIERNAQYRATSLKVFGKVGTTETLLQDRVLTYNPRGQMTRATVTDRGIDPARPYQVDLAYCEPADVGAGRCPLVGQLLRIDGPRTDVADITTITYHAYDAPGCVDGVPGCTFRKGDIQSVRNAEGHVTEFLGYDDAGRPTEILMPGGVLVKRQHDDQGQLVSVTVMGEDPLSEADDRRLQLAYESNRLLKRITHADGRSVELRYDTSQRLREVIDQDGNKVRYGLDGASNRTRIEVLDAGGAVLKSLQESFNTLNQIQTRTNAAGRTTTYQYDAGGRPDRVTHPNGRVDDLDADRLDRISRVVQDIQGRAEETKLQFDFLDQVRHLTDPENLGTRLDRDGLGAVTAQVSPDSGATTLVRDAAGNVTRKTDAAGRITDRRYDRLNRLVQVDVPGDPGATIRYRFDVPSSTCAPEERFTIGRMAEMQDPSGQTIFCYNRYGDLVRKVQQVGSRSLVLRWEYLPNGRLKSMTLPDGSVVDYQHDVQGRISEIGVTQRPGRRQVLRDITYHPFGPVSGFVFGNGRAVSRGLNRDYAPSTIRDDRPGGLNLSYDYDVAGNIQSIREGSATSPVVRNYAYDRMDRLTHVRDGSGVLLYRYDYDRVGNRVGGGSLREVITGTSGPPGSGNNQTAWQWFEDEYLYLPGSHALVAFGETEYRYDGSGNMFWRGHRTIDIDPGDTGPVDPFPVDGQPVDGQPIDGGGLPPPGSMPESFDYDANGRLRHVSAGETLLLSYRHNGLGERVERVDSEGTVLSIYDQAGRWIGDYTAQGAPIQQVLWLEDLPVAVLDGPLGTLNFIEADGAGTPRVVIDALRDVPVWTWSIRGEPFGATEPDRDPDRDGHWFTFDMRFPGQRHEAMTGLSYNYYRDYDPKLGRYVQSDPIGLNGGINTFAYVAGNPLRYTDSLGLAIDSKDGCDCVRPPDYLTFQFELGPFGISTTWTRYGDVFLGGTLGLDAPKPKDWRKALKQFKRPSAGASVGWLLDCDNRRERVSGFLNGEAWEGNIGPVSGTHNNSGNALGLGYSTAPDPFGAGASSNNYRGNIYQAIYDFWGGY